MRKIDWNQRVVSAHEIMPGLWIGNQAAALDPEFLTKIDVVINASKHIPFGSDSTINIRVPVNDPGPVRIVDHLWKDQDIMLEHLDDVVEKIWKHRKSGKRVLIHCHAGAQRSAAIMTAYFIKHGAWSKVPKSFGSLSPIDLRMLKFETSARILVKKRPVAFFGGRSVNFRPALLKWILRI